MNESRIYRGTTLLFCPRPVLGRISFHPDQKEDGGALLWVCRTLPPSLSANTVGLILTQRPTEPLPDRWSVPVLVIEGFGTEEEGAIALLDPENHRLTVNPDVSSLKEYARLMAGEERSTPLAAELPHLSPMGFWEEGGGLCREPELIGRLTEDRMWQAGHITVLLHAKRRPAEAIRQLYLAGIFGGFSLLFEGVLCRKDQQEILSTCHRCFGELWGEGREFNGYLPRGILLDTPLSMELGSPLPGADFFCFDYEALCRGFGGSLSSRVRRLTEARMEEVCRRLSPREKKLLLHSAPDRVMGRWILQNRFDEIFLPRDAIPKAERIFSELLRG